MHKQTRACYLIKPSKLMRNEDCGICVFLRMPFPSYRTEKTIKPLQASNKTFDQHSSCMFPQLQFSWTVFLPPSCSRGETNLHVGPHSTLFEKQRQLNKSPLELKHERSWNSEHGCLKNGLTHLQQIIYI